MSNVLETIPQVGDGATVYVGSDRYPATVIAVEFFKTGKRVGQVREVAVRWDKATVVPSDRPWYDPEWDIQPNPDGRVESYTVDAKGNIRGVGFGHRTKYSDPSF